jgi:hypothetical protein
MVSKLRWRQRLAKMLASLRERASLRSEVDVV